MYLVFTEHGEIKLTWKNECLVYFEQRGDALQPLVAEMSISTTKLNYPGKTFFPTRFSVLNTGKYLDPTSIQFSYHCKMVLCHSPGLQLSQYYFLFHPRDRKALLGPS